MTYRRRIVGKGDLGPQDRSAPAEETFQGDQARTDSDPQDSSLDATNQASSEGNEYETTPEILQDAKERLQGAVDYVLTVIDELNTQKPRDTSFSPFYIYMYASQAEPWRLHKLAPSLIKQAALEILDEIHEQLTSQGETTQETPLIPEDMGANRAEGTANVPNTTHAGTPEKKLQVLDILKQELQQLDLSNHLSIAKPALQCIKERVDPLSPPRWEKLFNRNYPWGKSRDVPNSAPIELILFILALAQSLVTPEPTPPEEAIKTTLQNLASQAKEILQAAAKPPKPAPEAEELTHQLEALALDLEEYDPLLIEEATLNTLAQSIKTAMQQSEPPGESVIRNPNETELYTMAEGVFNYTIHFCSLPTTACKPYFPFSSLEWPEDALPSVQARQLYLEWLNNYLHGEAAENDKTAQFAIFVTMISSMPPQQLKDTLLTMERKRLNEIKRTLQEEAEKLASGEYKSLAAIPPLTSLTKYPDLLRAAVRDLLKEGLKRAANQSLETLSKDRYIRAKHIDVQKLIENAQSVISDLLLDLLSPRTILPSSWSPPTPKVISSMKKWIESGQPRPGILRGTSLYDIQRFDKLIKSATKKLPLLYNNPRTTLQKTLQTRWAVLLAFLALPDPKNPNKNTSSTLKMLLDTYLEYTLASSR